MEFKDRKAANPGRIKLKDITTDVETTYDVTLADEPTEAGTPINAELFARLKEEILNETVNIGQKGEKGDNGDTGIAGNYITSITFTKV